MDEYDLVDFDDPVDATRNDWERLKPLSKLRKQIPFREIYSEEEYRFIKHGLIPQVMEDKWFIFLEDDWLYLHRSWTGLCVYKLRFEKIAKGHKVSEAWVNQNPKQYKETSDEYNTVLLRYLIERLLLCKKVPFPAKADSSNPFAGFFSMVGWGRGNGENGAIKKT